MQLRSSGIPLSSCELSKGLYPAPPNLTKVPLDDPAEAFWVIKHGIKASGMPAWGKSMEDEYLWGMVAFLRQLPDLDPEEYQAAVKADMDFLKTVTYKLERQTGDTVGDLAWVASESRMTGTSKDQPVDMQSTETLVLKKTPAGWKGVHVHWSPAPFGSPHRIDQTHRLQWCKGCRQTPPTSVRSRSPGAGRLELPRKT